MKKAIFTIVLGFIAFSLFAQNNDMLQIQNKLTSLEASNARLTTQLNTNQKAIAELTNQLKVTNENVIQLQAALAASQAKLEEVTGTMDQKISKSEQASAEQIDHLGKSLSMNTIYWIIAFLVVGFISYFLYRKLRGRLSKEKADIYNEIKATNEQLKFDLSSLVTKNADDIKFMYSSEMKDLSDKNNKALDELNHQIEGKIKGVTEKMEAQISALKQAKTKASRSEQQKAEI
ncbi:MAG TPA: hypothetical protein VK172_08640 [Lentimicrobium sp.]|nr:hypothetical protein [Lentimicrobium sp.]